jgi:hypothetical protein
MNCRDFLNEFEDRNALSETATLHLNSCADCKKINGVQTRVWQIIEGFEQVAAPKDFDFRVKARIANAKASDFQPTLFPVLRYVLGLSVVGLVLAFVVFNGIYSLDDKTVPQVAEKNVQTPIQKVNPLSEPSPNEQIAHVIDSPTSEDKKSVANNLSVKPQQIGNKKEAKTFSNKNQLIAVKSPKMPRVKSSENDDKNGISSQVTLLRQATSIFPKGIPNPNRKVENSSNFRQSSSLTPEQILNEFGIEISAKNGNRQVKTVKPNSVGERSGVKVGDVIEEIDGKKLSSEPISAQSIEVKKLTVLRGAEKKEITLRNLPD